jgi:hypothetical protein
MSGGVGEFKSSLYFMVYKITYDGKIEQFKKLVPKDTFQQHKNNLKAFEESGKKDEKALEEIKKFEKEYGKSGDYFVEGSPLWEAIDTKVINGTEVRIERI